jgi:hypothetical protein
MSFEFFVEVTFYVVVVGIITPRSLVCCSEYVGSEPLKNVRDAPPDFTVP